MRERMQELLDEPMPAGMDTAEVEEARALLAWVADHHFTYLGYREYELTARTRCARSRAPGSGCCAAAAAQSDAASRSCRRAVRALAREPHLLVLTKANARSPVHRPAYLDYIGVKRFDDEGNVVGERRFLGLYTTGAYREVPANIPVLRRKAQAVRRARRVRARQPRRQGADRDHRHVPARRAVPDRRRTSCTRSRVGILELGERQRVRLFMRTDRYERFVSCLVFLPRDRFNTANRVQDRRDPVRGARRGVARLGAAADRVGARAHPLHAARAAPA